MQKNKSTETKDNYFIRMMSPDAEKKAFLYLKEEEKNLSNLLFSFKNLNKKNFVVVGAGALWYLDLVFEKVNKYIAIDPLSNIFIQKQIRFIISKHHNIKIIGKELGIFKKKELGSNSSIFIFHFNILAYIKNPISIINKYLKHGDILYLSTWSDSTRAKKVRQEYFNFLGFDQFKKIFNIDPKKNSGICDFDSFPFKKLKLYKSHERIKGIITDLLIIYC